jgi:hypothetical protein
MLSDYRDYYKRLLADIDSYNNSGLSEVEKVEACFICSLDYWRQIQRLVKERDFCTYAEEILFFKEIKPCFTSLVEYFTYRYHALLFIPSHDNNEMKRFWQWEIRKIQRFYEHNEAFYRYIRGGATDMDELYFVRGDNLRRDNCNSVFNHHQIHDLDPQTATAYGYLVSMIRAYELYEIHIREEINKLDAICLIPPYPL